MSDRDDFTVADSSMLSDADWAALNELRRTHETHGSKGLSEALIKLEKDDPVRYITIVAAFSPIRFLMQ
jgi:hypothetical protein